MPALWILFLAVGSFVHLVGWALGPDVHGVAWQLLGWSTVGVLVWRSRQQPGPEAVPWRWLALGAGLLLAGGLALDLHTMIDGGDDYVFPSAGDPLYTLGYLALVTGFMKLVRQRTAVSDRGDLIDSLIVTAAAALIAWVTILAPFVRDGSIDLADRVLAVNYSILTLLLVLAITRLAVGPGFRAPSYYLLAACTGTIFVSDVFLTLQTTGTFQQEVYELVAPFSYAFVAASALHPSVGRLTARPDYVNPTLTWKRMGMLAGALLMGPAVMVFQAARGSEIDLPVVVTGWVALSVLVLTRLGLLIREEERAATRERVLRELGSVLVVGGTESEMHSAALWSVLELTDGLPTGRASVVLIDDGMVEVGAAVGRQAIEVGTRAEVASLPREVQEALTQRQAVSIEQVKGYDLTGRNDPRAEASLVVAPLVGRGTTTGAIIVASDAPIERGVVSALTSVAMEVSLAIESAALTADLHRRKSDRRFRALVENSSEFVLVVDAEDRGQFASPVVERLLGRPESYFTGPLPDEFVHPEDQDEFTELIAAARERATEDDPHEVRLRHADGGYRWFEMRARDLTNEPEIAGLVLTARDITDRRLAEQRLARSEARFRSLVQNSSDVVAVIDEGGAITYVSPAVTLMLGFMAEELVGTNVMRLLPADEVTRAMQLLEGVTANPFEQLNIEMRLRDRAGSWRNVDVTISDMRQETAVQGIVLNVRDVTVRRALEEDLQRKALHDELTGLGNRVHFEKRLNRAISRTDARLDQVAVLMIDLDDFKEINDSLGHRAGDQLLMSIAERIRTCLRVSDVAARLGGDEFGILLEDTYGEAEVLAVADRVLLAISQPFLIDGRHITSSASIGIVVDADRSSSSEALMRAADVAMYLAKERGKGRYEVFQEAVHSGAFERLQLKAALSDAITGDGLVLHYQPIVDLNSQSIIGCEALVRWNHPERGLVPPGEFIPLAEDSGLIVGLGRWVLNEACRQMSEWERDHPTTRDLRVSVNLSVRQIDSPSLMVDIADAIEYGGITPNRLTLEITESLVMNDDAETLARLAALRAQGITLAVDDFGTGYSSLGYIQQFPLDVIKIDRSFVGRLDDPDSGTYQLVRTIVDLARGLNATTVAEGIETMAQLEALRSMGCQYGQGFYFARPVPSDQFIALLEKLPPNQPSSLGG